MRSALNSRLSVFIILFCSFIYSSGYSQSLNNDAASTKSVNFYFINGYAFAYKFYDQDNSSLRILLDLSSHQENTDLDNHYIYSNNYGYPTDQTSSEKRKSYYVSFSPQYLLKVYKGNNAGIYIGGGPLLAFSYSETKSNLSYPNRATSTRFDRIREYSAGLNAFVGLEAKVTKSIGLFAETHLSGGKNWGRNNSDNTSSSSYDNGQTLTSFATTIIKNDSWYYDLTSIRIGLSVYL